MTSKLKRFHPASYVYIQGDRAIAQHLPDYLEAPYFGLDCETSGIDPHHHQIRLIQIAIPKQPVLVIDLPSLEKHGIKLLRSLLHNRARKVGQTLKFDWMMLHAAGLGLSGPFFDTQLAWKILTAGLDVGQSLQAIAAKVLKRKLDKKQQLSDFSQNAKLTPQQLQYAADDAAVVIQLYPKLLKRLRHHQLTEVAKLEFACIPATAQIEYHGLKLDRQQWQHYTESIIERKTELTRQLTEQLRLPTNQISLLPELTDTINLHSPIQLLKALNQQGIPVTSTNRATLIPHAASHPILEQLLEWRRMDKINVKLPNHIHPTTGRIHASWFQYGARSGRFTCRNPALQTIPRTPQSRRCFVAEPGRCLIKADFSQIELRILAKLSGDRRLCQAYQQGIDVHRLTASLMLEKPIDQISDEERRKAKAVNFGIIYLVSAPRLQSQAESDYGVIMSLEEAKTFIKRFFLAYPGVKHWHDRIRRAYGRGEKESRTLLGRRRRWSGKPKLTEMVNHPVQGTNADITKLALAKLDRQLQNTDTWIVGTWHDEILIEPLLTHSQRAQQILHDCMVSAANTFLHPIPVTVDLKVGHSWDG